MTVAVILAGLLPILLCHCAGSEVMSRIAAPMIGGMLTAPLLSMLVIPAALHSDAVIDAIFTESNESIQLEVKDGKVINYAQGGVPAEDGGSSSLLIHFPLPVTRWYDDLVFT
jgi:hypothetical protein